MPEGNSIQNYEDWGYKVFENQTFSGFEKSVICMKKDYAIAVSLIHGNTRSRIVNTSRSKGLERAYEMCNESKYLYRVQFSKTFPVSTKSLAIELYLHAVPEAAAAIVKAYTDIDPTPNSLTTAALEKIASYFDSHCQFSDMGIRTGWKKYMDKVFDAVYDAIV